MIQQGLPQDFPDLNLYQLEEATLDKITVTLFRSDRLSIKGYDIIVSKDTDQLQRLEQWFEQNKITTMTNSQWELTRIKQGVPQVGIDVTDQHLPQEAGLNDFIDFKKGCYLGQEVVARLHYKGHVNKTLCIFESKDQNFQSGEAINFQDKQIGSITSFAFDPNIETTYLMGYATVKSIEQTKEFQVNNKKIVMLEKD